MSSKRTFLLNFKAYSNSYGEKAVKLSEQIDQLADKYSNVEMIIAVPATMIERVSRSVKRVKVYAQHVDPVKEGAYTGHITADMVKEAGGKGSMINHSEKKIRLDELAESLKVLQSAGLESVVCIDRHELVGPAAMLTPTYVLVEPPELIGTGISVSRAKPEVIIKSVEEIKKVGGKLLVGAGISNRDDSKRSVELGAAGVGLASAVMKDQNPVAKAEEIISGLL
ncbi:MAG: triose-phosphate isomerase [Nitrososphaeria archaeon]|nr:triose-phosphate isomerase [Conexivisphaerales archaeon]